MSELWRLSASACVQELDKGAISPLNLVEAAIERHQAIGERINALVTLMAERAREQARAMMRRRPAERGRLRGLPIAIKDLHDVAGVRSTSGSPIFADRIAATSDIMVQHLEQEGAIPLAMSNTPEFGAGGNTYNPVFGATRNPWNIALNCGGSSRGSAAALAAGEIWLATGSDLGGSLRTPAAFCHVVGLRPSPGLIAADPGDIKFDTLPVVGPMARNVADVALMLEAMVFHHPDDPLSFPSPPIPYQQAALRPTRPRRIGFCLEPAGLPVEPEVLAICREALAKLEKAGLAVEEKSPDFRGAPEAFQTLRALGYAASMATMAAHHRDRLKPEILWNIEKGERLETADILRAMRRRGTLYRDVVAFFADFDLLILPGAPILPRASEEIWPREIAGERLEDYVAWLSLASILTLTACPVLALPAGFSPDGRPMGLQILGRPRGEAALLSQGAWIEAVLGQTGLTPIDPRQP